MSDDTLTLVRRLHTASADLPPPPSGVGFHEWTGSVLAAWDGFPEAERGEIAALVRDAFDGWMAAISIARGHGIACVVSAALSARAA